MSNNGKTLLMGQFSLPEFEFLRNVPWVFTEKVDGTNIRVMIEGGRVSFGGKTDNAQIPAPLVARLREVFDPLAEKLTEIFPSGGCLYGEGYGPKIQKGGGNYGSAQDFVLFDVLAISVDYATIATCPKHRELLNATLTDLTTLGDFVNPAIIATLKRKIQNGQLNPNNSLPNTFQANVDDLPEKKQLESATSSPDLDSASKHTTECCQLREAGALSVENSIPSKEGAAAFSRSRSITATKREPFEDFFALGATLQSTRRNEILNGLLKPKCICKVGEWWLERHNVEDVAAKLGIRVVPIIGEGTIADMVEITRAGITSTWGNFAAEGIVARPKVELRTRNNSRIITKLKTRDFLLANEKSATAGSERNAHE
jgi:hypothetical protein